MHTLSRRIARVRSEERGVAMVVAIGVVMVLLTLTALVAQGSVDLSRTSNEDTG
jgi:Tfp pilus assembly protein PilX